MKTLEMITEWRKGCSVAGPAHDTAFRKPDGTTPAGLCIACTDGLIDALEKALREPELGAVVDAHIAIAGGFVQVPDETNPRGFVVKFEPLRAMAAALKVAAGAIELPHPEQPFLSRETEVKP